MTVGYSVLATSAILRVVDPIVDLRVKPHVERERLDVNLHGETGYAMAVSLGRAFSPDEANVLYCYPGDPSPKRK